MYQSAQEKVRGYITKSLNGLSDKWRFSIDTTNEDKPVIVGIGPSEREIREPIEKFHKFVDYRLLAGMFDMYEANKKNRTYRANCKDDKMPIWDGCLMIKCWLKDVLEIYGIKMGRSTSCFTMFEVKSVDEAACIMSFIYGNRNSAASRESPIDFISPFSSDDYRDFLLKEELVSPLLLLLDPIRYFKKYSAIIEKYPGMEKNHTLGIFELFLGYFPEVGAERVGKC